MNRLLEQLRTQYRELATQYDEILDRCAADARDPSEVEAGLLEGLRNQMDPLGERIVQMRDVDDRRLSTMTALADYPTIETGTGDGERTSAGTGGPGAELVTRSNGPGSPIVRIRGDELVYRRDGGAEGTGSFFRDLMHAREGDRAAIERLDRHAEQMRAVGTTVTGAGAVPPVWLPEEFAPLARGARPIADRLRRVPITSATPVTVGVQTAGAVVGDQVEGQPPDDGDFGATPLVTTPKTKSGTVDVTRQLIDGSNPAVDTIVYGDLMGAYAEAVETEVTNAIAAQGGIAATIPVDTSAGTIIAGITRAAVAVRTARKRAPTDVFMTHVGFGALSSETDGNGRPLITTGRYGPQNAQGLAEPTQYGDGVAGEVVGLSIVPSWAGANDHMFVVVASDLLLLESSTLTFRYEEVVGPEKIRLGVWGYVGVATGRYPKGIAAVTITPAPTGAADEGAGTGDGPGTMKASSKTTAGK